MGKYGQIWAYMSKYEQIWANMSKYGQTTGHLSLLTGSMMAMVFLPWLAALIFSISSLERGLW